MLNCLYCCFLSLFPATSYSSPYIFNVIFEDMDYHELLKADQIPNLPQIIIDKIIEIQPLDRRRLVNFLVRRGSIIVTFQLLPPNANMSGKWSSFTHNCKTIDYLSFSVFNSSASKNWFPKQFELSFIVFFLTFINAVKTEFLLVQLKKKLER